MQSVEVDYLISLIDAMSSYIDSQIDPQNDRIQLLENELKDLQSNNKKALVLLINQQQLIASIMSEFSQVFKQKNEI